MYDDILLGRDRFHDVRFAELKNSKTEINWFALRRAREVLAMFRCLWDDPVIRIGLFEQTLFEELCPGWSLLLWSYIVIHTWASLVLSMMVV